VCGDVNWTYMAQYRIQSQEGICPMELVMVHMSKLEGDHNVS